MARQTCIPEVVKRLINAVEKISVLDEVNQDDLKVIKDDLYLVGTDFADEEMFGSIIITKKYYSSEEISTISIESDRLHANVSMSDNVVGETEEYDHIEYISLSDYLQSIKDVEIDNEESLELYKGVLYHIVTLVVTAIDTVPEGDLLNKKFLNSLEERTEIFKVCKNLPFCLSPIYDDSEQIWNECAIEAEEIIKSVKLHFIGYGLIMLAILCMNYNNNITTDLTLVFLGTIFISTIYLLINIMIHHRKIKVSRKILGEIYYQTQILSSVLKSK